jgi:hypothetical protein
LVAYKNEPKNQEEMNANGYNLEARLLKAIEDISSDNPRVVSRKELAYSIGKQEDEFDARMWMLTLEGKGLIKMTELGYVLTVRGRQRDYKIRFK